MPQQMQRKAAVVTMYLAVENNSKFVRGKKRARENIERYHLAYYGMKKLASGEYELTIPYDDDADLDRTVYDLLAAIFGEADNRHCFIEADVYEKGTNRHW